MARTNPEAVNGFADRVTNAGKESPEGKESQVNSGFDDLVQYNDGFKRSLTGTPQQIAERMIEFKNAGADLLLSDCYVFRSSLPFVVVIVLNPLA